MNAGPDVERVISDWLAEEDPGRAPDRILDAASSVIDRTKQRRFVAAWRDPMLISSARLLVAAAVLVVAVVGAGLVGRMTASSGTLPPAGSVPSATPTPSAPSAAADPAAAMVVYRTARDAICLSYQTRGDRLKGQLNGIYDAATSPADRSAKIAALTQFLALSQTMAGELGSMAVPPAIAADHATNVAEIRDVNQLIAQELLLLRSGQLVGAGAIDASTDPISAAAAQFEGHNNLARCP